MFWFKKNKKSVKESIGKIKSKDDFIHYFSSFDYKNARYLNFKNLSRIDPFNFRIFSKNRKLMLSFSMNVSASKLNQPPSLSLLDLPVQIFVTDEDLNENWIFNGLDLYDVEKSIIPNDEILEIAEYLLTQIIESQNPSTPNLLDYKENLELFNKFKDNYLVKHLLDKFV